MTDTTAFLRAKFREEHGSRYDTMPDWFWNSVDHERAFQDWSRRYLNGRTALQAEIDDARANLESWQRVIAADNAVGHECKFAERWARTWRDKLDDLLFQQAGAMAAAE